MTSTQPPTPTEVLPEGLTSWNADQYVPLPDKAEAEFVNDGVTVKFGHDEFGGVVITMEWGDDPHCRRMRLGAALEGPALAEVSDKIFKPLLDREAEIARLAAAADAAFEAQQEQEGQERRAHITASAFRMQRVTKKGGMSSYLRLHKHTCSVLIRATSRPDDYAMTLDELLTVELPKVHERYEELVSERAAADNYARRARRIPFDNTVLALCGQCKPIGQQSKFVSDELHKLAHPVVADPNAMTDVARLLLAVENGSKETDAAYREARDNLA